VIRRLGVITRRNLLHLRADREQLIAMLIQPVVFLVLFVSIFGGAVAGSSQRYLQFSLPGMLVQAVVFTGMQTAIGLNADFRGGIVDRFRSLRVPPAVLVGGRVLADAVRITAGATVLVGVGAVLGFGFAGGPAGTVAAVLLAILFGVVMCWPMAVVGLAVRDLESVQIVVFLVVLPLTFASSIFAPPDSMPDWMRVVVRLNPVTSVVDTVRALMLGEPVGSSLALCVGWLAVVMAVSIPLVAVVFRRRC
jgi:ABC transporter DrrB family efflux protein